MSGVRIELPPEVLDEIVARVAAIVFEQTARPSQPVSPPLSVDEASCATHTTPTPTIRRTSRPWIPPQCSA